MISIEKIININEVQNRDVIYHADALDFIGGRLSLWLERFLTDLGVGEHPKIEGDVSPHCFISGRVFVAKGAIVEPGAMIQGPCYIGPDAEIRHCAYIRGQVYVGARAVVGHTTEVKGSTFFDDAKAGHFAYVGDSVLGRGVNLGAGTKLANLKLRGNEVKVIDPNTDKVVATGFRKMGAILGDFSQTGCNAVLSPGTILLPRTGVLPCVHYHGTLKTGIASSNTLGR